MAIMLAETHNAFKAPGMPEAEAQVAVEELAGYATVTVSPCRPLAATEIHPIWQNHE
jgi:hypothetical protein